MYWVLYYSGMTASVSGESGARVLGAEDSLGTGRAESHSTWAGLVGGTAASSPRWGQWMSWIQTVQIGGAWDGAGDKGSYNRSRASWDSRMQVFFLSNRGNKTWKGKSSCYIKLNYLSLCPATLVNENNITSGRFSLFFYFFFFILF